MNTIPVTDSKFITYLNYKGIRPVNSKRENNKVSVYYIDDENFRETKHDYMADKNFSAVLDAKHKTEEMLRMTL